MSAFRAKEQDCSPPESPETIGGLCRRISKRLNAAIAPDNRHGRPDLDARIILAHALGVDAAALILRDANRVDAATAKYALSLAERRVAGEPVARIVGEKEFWSLPLRLSPETLVPRPDTETVVSAALDALAGAGRSEEALAILDLGTGSGAILLALLSELPTASGVGVDRAPGAAQTAAENARRLGLAGRAVFVVSDWGAAIAKRFDVVISNPPYIPTADIATLPVDVSRYDPDMAFNGGADGLDGHRAVLEALDHALAKDGLAFLEVGAGQADAVTALAVARGWQTIHRHRDYGGIERVVQLQRRGEAGEKLGLEIGREPARFRAP